MAPISFIPAYQMPADRLARELKTDTASGLSTAEAEARLLRYGENALEIHVTNPWYRLLLEQFLSPLVGVLLLAGGMSFFFRDWLEGAAILVVILINALIGFAMEWQASRSMEALRRLSQPNAKVIREGRLARIPTARLVPGDIVFLEAGDLVPADCRIVQEQQLGVQEAALTGESMLVDKQAAPLNGEAPLPERYNLVFKGTEVARGNARAMVYATGVNTELGAIARLVEEASKEATPLEHKLRTLSQRLLWLTLILVLLLLFSGLLTGREPYLLIRTAMALAVAAIPEGLPIVATIALARGMLRLARHRVVVKKLSAVETLGEAQVIFTDKTGTLTENILKADTVLLPGGALPLDAFAGPAAKSPEKNAPMELICRISALCNNAALGDGAQNSHVGDPLEVALLQMALAAGFSPKEERSAFPRLQELPFDSEIMMMGTLHASPGGGFLACIKGAPEVILPRVDFALSAQGGDPLKDQRWWQQEAARMAERGLRTLALAYRHLAGPSVDFSRDFVLVGIVGFLDPPRAEVPRALEYCREAGVRVVMVTGDHPETARHIAGRIGLTPEEPASVLPGDELEKEASDEGRLLNARVFARVSPAQKLRLVTLYQEHGFTVGMTGDGVNDSPALKKADIGIAMGLHGTEAAKEAADLVLEDDAFPSIVLAIRLGRGIFDNIRHFVVYLLSCNLSELLVVTVASLVNLSNPLMPLQILFLNLVTDVFPALALAMNRESGDVMKRPPRPRGEHILNRGSWRAIAVYALCMTAGAVSALLFAVYGLQENAVVANNMVFYTLVLAQLWHVFNLPRHFFSAEVWRNRFAWYATLLCLLITAAAYAFPLTRQVLQLQTLPPALFGWIFLFSLLPVGLVQLLKAIRWV